MAKAKAARKKTLFAPKQKAVVKAKKGEEPAVEEAVQTAAPAAAVSTVDLDKTSVKKAIEDGKAVLKDGKSKADAAWAIFQHLKDEPKEVIVAAFVRGATLTDKGALTYWYNCRKRAAKEAAPATA